MSGEAIPLAKGFNVKKLDFPVFMSTKIDGVPIRIDLKTGPAENPGYNVSWVSRQHELVPSVWPQVMALAEAVSQAHFNLNVSFVAEIGPPVGEHIPFKVLNGLVSRKNEEQPQLVLYVFDFHSHLHEHLPFYRRKRILQVIGKCFPDSAKVLKQAKIDTPEQLAPALELAMNTRKDVEGFVIRSHNALFIPGSRKWDYQKVKREPTIDLRIVGVEEAVSKDKKPLGLAGRLIAKYPHTTTVRGKKRHKDTIGVGPGKLTHAERKKLWEDYQWASKTYANQHGKELEHFFGGIAEIKYMKDDSYDALRQATFQRWRPDKSEPDA